MSMHAESSFIFPCITTATACPTIPLSLSTSLPFHRTDALTPNQALCSPSAFQPHHWSFIRGETMSRRDRGEGRERNADEVIEKVYSKEKGRSIAALVTVSTGTSTPLRISPSHGYLTIMQQKINKFFKKSIPTSANHSLLLLEDELGLWESKRHVINQIFKRQVAKSAEFGASEDVNDSSFKKPNPNGCLSPERSGSGCTGIFRTKKRSYAQLHLEFGQSDFLLRSCSECGMKYSPGDEGDEKAHLEFHKKYTNGIHLKRIVDVQNSFDGVRIVLVQDCDLPAQRNKVEEVMKMMKIDLGCGWIYHRQRKVYLFVSACRIVGCLVAEPIKEAFRMVSSGDSVKDNGMTKKEAKARAESYPLQFGNIVFRRVLATKGPSVKEG